MPSPTSARGLDLDAVRAELPSILQAIHLDHAGISPVPRRAAAAMQHYAQDVLEHGAANMASWLARVERARANLCQLLGVPVGDVALTRSTSHGLMLLANALPWQQGDNVVITGMEFPANVYPWKSLAWRQVETRVAPAGEDGRVSVDAVAAVMDGRTRVLSVSWVEFGNGFRHDLAALSELCATRGVWLCVDVIQGLGALPLDLSRLGVDMACGATHKWLLGPAGSGYLYCRPEVIARMIPALVGWFGVERPFDFFDWDLSRLRPDARRFEESGPTIVTALGVEGCTDFLLAAGAPAIAGRVRALTDQLVEGLGRAGHRVTSPRGDGEWSGIVTFEPRSGDPAATVERLARERIVAVVRGRGVRLSPHFYNTAEEMSRVLGCI